ncbi:anti-sigma factor family protein [Paenibacillus montanisoli]|uniref:Putative zinc-finger domain-containing protein n=1 Tax=Paenibacillus montanisoli TaxID=2081970 RepID=A0A328U252_9BACL|nr:zf-HC2 domain-containing protein [Paenibacillus montanisoli]RAP76750.1 hypothetical protein DL346_15520 [Paenibacillus montanisoli]
MNCQEVMDYMQRQLDDDLDEREIEILMTHTRHCPECTAMMERLQMLSSGLTSLPKVTPSYSLVDAILPRLAELQTAQEGIETDAKPFGMTSEQSESARRLPSKRKWTDRFSIRALGGVIAAGVIVGLFIVNYNPNRSPGDSDGNMTASSEDRSSFVAANDSAASDTAMDTTDSANAAAANEAAPAEEPQTEAAPSSSDDQSMLKSMDSRNVDPNGETMPPLTSASEDNGEPVVKGNSPNYEFSGQSDGGAAADAGATDNALEDTGDVANKADTEVSDTDHQNSIASKEPVMASPISKDGNYQAFVVEDTVRIYTVQDSLMIFQGPKRAEIANLKWSEDSSVLTYEAKNADGTKQVYAVDPKTQSEQLQSSK